MKRTFLLSFFLLLQVSRVLLCSLFRSAFSDTCHYHGPHTLKHFTSYFTCLRNLCVPKAYQTFIFDTFNSKTGKHILTIIFQLPCATLGYLLPIIIGIRVDIKNPTVSMASEQLLFHLRTWNNRSPHSPDGGRRPAAQSAPLGHIARDWQMQPLPRRHTTAADVLSQISGAAIPRGGCLYAYTNYCTYTEPRRYAANKRQPT